MVIYPRFVRHSDTANQLFQKMKALNKYHIDYTCFLCSSVVVIVCDWRACYYDEDDDGSDDVDPSDGGGGGDDEGDESLELIMLW